VTVQQLLSGSIRLVSFGRNAVLVFSKLLWPNFAIENQLRYIKNLDTKIDKLRSASCGKSL